MATTVLPGQSEEVKAKTQKLPPWNVVLLDDDDHSYEYVIEMLRRLFGIPVVEAFLMAKEVDQVGRVIVLTTHRERAELEQQRIHCYGADPRIPRCRGSMSAVIEPAQG
jgi:ATP-dependent Clp protease adaptor protein ClpS